MSKQIDIDFDSIMHDVINVPHEMPIAINTIEGGENHVAQSHSVNA